ncbi:MAG: exopolyphosphatase [Rhodospirillales bacterium]
MAAGEPGSSAADGGVIAAKRSDGRVGVVDIGSNTVRLVVYDAPARLPIPIFNEKAQCELGSGLAKSGRLNPKGVTEALRSLARFVELAAAMDVGHIELVATAAVRDASDGPAFVERAERTCGLPVHVLSGEEEARLAAVGLRHGTRGADGVLGDLGGGSLDLVGLDGGEIGAFATLPLGHLRLSETCDGNREQARRVLAEWLATVPWLAETTGRSVYAVGGSWRALARIFIEQTHHPLHVVDNFTIGFFDALRLSDLIAGLSRNTMEMLSGIARRRIDTLPYAAMALSALLQVTRPSQVVFSALGMREGQMLELLPSALRGQDPLISACESQAERTGRFTAHGREIHDWMTPLFRTETEEQCRLRLATCLLSDIGWSEHPDYRALHSYHRVLRIPYPRLTHSDRAEMALAILVRYDGDPEDRMVAPHRNLLDDQRQFRARVIGLALKLAHTLSGGAPGLLSQTRLRAKNGRLTFEVPDNRAVFVGEALDRRFKTLARAVEARPNAG